MEGEQDTGPFTRAASCRLQGGAAVSLSTHLPLTHKAPASLRGAACPGTRPPPQAHSRRESLQPVPSAWQGQDAALGPLLPLGHPNKQPGRTAALERRPALSCPGGCVLLSTLEWPPKSQLCCQNLIPCSAEPLWGGAEGPRHGTWYGRHWLEPLHRHRHWDPWAEPTGSASPPWPKRKDVGLLENKTTAFPPTEQ